MTFQKKEKITIMESSWENAENRIGHGLQKEEKERTLCTEVRWY